MLSFCLGRTSETHLQNVQEMAGLKLRRIMVECFDYLWRNKTARYCELKIVESRHKLCHRNVVEGSL